MDYQIIDGLPVNGKKVKVIEVFNTATGKTIATTRRVGFESKDAWVARAFENARALVAA